MIFLLKNVNVQHLTFILILKNKIQIVNEVHNCFIKITTKKDPEKSKEKMPLITVIIVRIRISF